MQPNLAATIVNPRDGTDLVWQSMLLLSQSCRIVFR